MDRSEIKKIALLSFFGVGDFVLAIPTIAKLRILYPESQIILFVRQGFDELIKSSVFIDSLVTFKYNNIKDKIIAFFLVLHHLLQNKIDLFINLHTPVPNTVGSNLLSFWRNNFLGLCSLARYRVGFDYQMSGILLTEKIRISEPELKSAHVKDLTLRLISALTKSPVIDGRLKINISELSQQSAARLLAAYHFDPSKKLVAIAPGSPQTSKLWPAENFSLLIDILVREFNSQIMLLGGQDDKILCQEIEKNAKSCIMNFAGKTNLGQLMALLEFADIVISIDSGPMHIASAIGKPIIALFSGQNLIENWAPLTEKYKIISKKLTCSPCFKSKCSNNLCMKLITADEIIEAAKCYLV